MKKTTLLIAIVALLTISLVSAYEINYKARCDFIQPATEYRPERVFPGIGIYGRLSNGNLICFLPQIRHKPTHPPIVVHTPVITNNTNSTTPISNNTNSTTPNCHNETVCNNSCHNETTTCKTWNYEQQCHNEQTTCRHYDTVTTWLKNNCHVDSQHDCLCTSHNHQNCHSHTTQTCNCWNHEQVCNNVQTTCKVWNMNQVCNQTCSTHQVCVN